jgi:transposase InsO family protein
MKLLLAADALAAYPDHNKRFDIYTDASDYQLGACIVQEGRPVAYFSRKLSAAQKNYITMEKEMLSIVAVLEEFRSMLLGAEIHIHTDHKNLTFNKDIKTQRVLRWRTKIEEFSPFVHYIEGEKNILADQLSRLEILPSPAQLAKGKKLVEPAEVTDDEDEDESYFLEKEFSGLYDQTIWDILECYLSLPETEQPENNPLSYPYIREKQQEDDALLALLNKYPNNYVYLELDDETEPIICYKKYPDKDDWKIALPNSMVPEVVKWFHEVLGHPGQTRLRDTLQARYHNPTMRSHIDKLVCESCQRHKLAGRGYGLLPEREVRVAPWEEVAIDLIGPWKVKVSNKLVEFSALTIIDTASNLVELVRIDNKTSTHIKDKFAQTWLCRYPRPVRCVHDKGGEFIGREFQWLLEMFSIKDVCSTSKNPQSNAICERMHQTVENVLRILVHTNPPNNLSKAKDIVDDALATAMHAMRTTVATTLGSTPGALAFSRDMFLNVPLIADWQAIARAREQHVNENLRRANKKRRQYDYAVGQRVLKKVPNPTTLGVRTEGPYPINRVHVNGNLTIELRNGVTERINIRRVLPYRE